jgi:hypothetical protein
MISKIKQEKKKFRKWAPKTKYENKRKR